MLIGDTSQETSDEKTQGPPGDLIKDVGIETFQQDVLDASKAVPVIVDFWAPWCGPCKQLGPAIEKLVRAYGGKVRLAKVNVDDNQPLAAQFQVQSIPAVFAFKDGKPVDGFMGVLPESQLKAFIAKLTGGEGSPIDVALEQAETLMADSQYEDALAIYQEILGQERENPAALGGALRCYMETGQDEVLHQVLDSLPPELAAKPEIAAIVTAIELKETSAESASGTDLAALERAVVNSPTDMQARFDLAMGRYAASDREGAVTDLLEIVRRDRKWDEDGARQQLVKLFEAFGPTDPLTIEGRRRLSSLLFN